MLQVSALFMKQTAQEETHNLSSRTIYSNSLRNSIELIKYTEAWAMLPEFLCLKDIEAGELNKMYISPTASTRPNQWATEISWLTARPRNAVMDYMIDELAKLPNR